LQELASRVLDIRPVGSDRETFCSGPAHRFFDVCMRSGLDRVLVEIRGGVLALDPQTGSARDIRSVAGARRQANLDDGGPEMRKPRQMGRRARREPSLTLTDEP